MMSAKPVVAALSKPAPGCLPKNRLAAMSRRHRVETIGRLAGGVAHDINNLLTAIMLNADVLCHALSEADLRVLAETTRMSAERASDLTRHFLAFVRGKRLPPVPTDVNGALRAFEPLLLQALGREIAFDIVTDARRATAMLERGQFESAILNLALNAKDSMTGGGSFLIRTFNPTDADANPQEIAGWSPGSVVVAVSDNGPGMPPAVLARAFEPFFTTKATGTGLGLSNVRAFVRQLGGEVRIDSQCGCGTTVALLLPLAEGEPDVAPRDAPPDSERLPTTCPRRA